VTKALLRPKQAMAKLGVGHTKFYDLRREGVVPNPVRLGPRAVGYPDDEIDGVIEKLKAERDEPNLKPPKDGKKR
jgi:predicted DNA-binding transcriptional regulator AlpA